MKIVVICIVGVARLLLNVPILSVQGLFAITVASTKIVTIVAKAGVTIV